MPPWWLESAANGIVITDTEGTITWVNPAFTTLTGYAAEEAVGRNVSMLRSEEQGPAIQGLTVPVTLSLSASEAAVVSKRLDSLRKVGFDVESFGGNSFVMRGAPASVKPGRAEQVLRDMMEELVEISVVCRGRLLFSRATSLGGPALRTAADTGTLEFLPEEERREARQSYRSLCNEVNRCVQAYQAQPGQPQVAQAYVLTSGDEHAGLADRLREATGLTVHRVSVFETLSGESEPPASQGSLSAALGLILEQDHPQGVPFDFLNPKKPKVVRDRRPLVLTLVVAAVAMAVATGLILFLNAKSRRQARLAHLTKRLGGRKGRTWSGLRKKLRDYHGLQARLDVVERWAGHRTNWLNELQALTDLFPPTDQVYIETCSLRQLKLPKLKRRARRSAKAGRSRQPKTPVASALLKGRARSRVLVDQLLRSAIATGRCRARPGGTQPRVDETPYRCRFSFSLDLLPPSVVQTQPSRGAATRPNAAKKADRKLQQRWGGSARAAAATGRELVTR